MRMKPLLIQTGTPPDAIRERHGDLPDWFAAALGLTRDQLLVVRAFEGEKPPALDVRTPAILTGSWSMVTDREAWSEALAEWIRAAMAIGTPLFGVCYGHQLMAHALGGEVGYLAQGREIGSQIVTLSTAGTADPALEHAGSAFTAQLTHMQTVLAPPAGTTMLARSARDQHQILRYGPNALSTQFHPEFTPAITKGIIEARADVLQGEGHDPDALRAAVTDAPFPTRMLRDFVVRYSQET